MNLMKRIRDGLDHIENQRMFERDMCPRKMANNLEAAASPTAHDAEVGTDLALL